MSYSEKRCYNIVYSIVNIIIDTSFQIVCGSILKALMMRECNRDYTYHLPGTKLTIEKGTIVFLSPKSLHRNPEYFPQPEMFIPERFTDVEKAKRHNYV